MAEADAFVADGDFDCVVEDEDLHLQGADAPLAVGVGVLDDVVAGLGDGGADVVVLLAAEGDRLSQSGESFACDRYVLGTA